MVAGLSGKPSIDLLALRRGVSLLSLLPPGAKPQKVAQATWRALCSFHEDTRPSMSVSLTDNGWMFNCFACGEAGSVIDYVMRTERLAFKDAIARMAAGSFVALTAPRRNYAPGTMALPCAAKGCGELAYLRPDETHMAGVSGYSPRDFSAAGWRLDASGNGWCPRCCTIADRHRRFGNERRATPAELRRAFAHRLEPWLPADFGKKGQTPQRTVRGGRAVHAPLPVGETRRVRQPPCKEDVVKR